MTRSEKRTDVSKFQRYRRGQQAKGMRLLRMWVPDPRHPDFKIEARRQTALLRGAPEERDALHFIEATMDWSEA